LRLRVEGAHVAHQDQRAAVVSSRIVHVARQDLARQQDLRRSAIPDLESHCLGARQDVPAEERDDSQARRRKISRAYDVVGRAPARGN